MTDPRAGLAAYYDLSPTVPDDVGFYLERLPFPHARVLELGCGTGRVSVALAERTARFVGVDHSADMAAVCRRRLAEAGLSGVADVVVGDITYLRLGARFDSIVAPFRVLQNLVTDAEVEGLFRTIREHLSPRGRCILNAFNPNRSPAELVELWRTPVEVEVWNVETPEGRVVRLDRRVRIQEQPLVIFPDLVYRKYRGPALVEELIHSIALRCWYPQELLDLIAAAGFTVTATWGGYHGQPWGEGPELVVEFGAA